MVQVVWVRRDNGVAGLCDQGDGSVHYVGSSRHAQQRPRCPAHLLGHGEYEDTLEEAGEPRLLAAWRSPRLRERDRCRQEAEAARTGFREGDDEPSIVAIHADQCARIQHVLGQLA